jgi:hypothetical protein
LVVVAAAEMRCSEGLGRSGGWLMLFGVRGCVAFDSVAHLTRAIRTFITGYNDRCPPFIWTKHPNEIVAKATRQRASDARHVGNPHLSPAQQSLIAWMTSSPHRTNQVGPSG